MTPGVPGHAEKEKRYLKSDLEFHGTGLPFMRSTVKRFLRAHLELTHDELFDLVAALWSRPVHESRTAAGRLLEARPDLVGAADLEPIERMLREAKTWALVDGMAVNVVGRLLLRDGDALPTMDRWATDDDFWIRRSALLSQMRTLKEGGSFDRFGRYADSMLEEKEFFIRKAIGWVLRET